MLTLNFIEVSKMQEKERENSNNMVKEKDTCMQEQNEVSKTVRKVECWEGAAEGRIGDWGEVVTR